MRKSRNTVSGAKDAAARDARAPARSVSLRSLFSNASFFAGEDVLAAGFSDQPARCRPGDVFVARWGDGRDGHEQVERALAAGACGVVAERMLPTFGMPLCIVPETDRAFARLAHAFAGDPATRMKVTAITGTSGKTTTAWLTAAVLAEAGLRVGVLSDLGCIDAVGTAAVPANLENPRTLARWLARLETSGCSHAVVEVSSRMLARHATEGVPFDTVVVTNLQAAHLDLHGSRQAYHAIKARILEGLAEQGTLVGNLDDEGVSALLARHASQSGPAHQIGFGLDGRADVSAAPVERSLWGQTFLLRHAGQIMPVAVGTPGQAFVRNGLAAAAVAARYRVPCERIARGLEAAGSIPGRLERIDRGQSFPVFLDSPTSGHALVSTLVALRRLTPGRLAVVADEAFAAAFGGEDFFSRRAAAWSDVCLVAPADMVADEVSAEVMASYARLDRLLDRLGGEDCLLVLGDVVRRGLPPEDPDGERTANLGDVIEGWLRLAGETVDQRRHVA